MENLGCCEAVSPLKVWQCYSHSYGCGFQEVYEGFFYRNADCICQEAKAWSWLDPPTIPSTHQYFFLNNYSKHIKISTKLSFFHGHPSPLNPAENTWVKKCNFWRNSALRDGWFWALDAVLLAKGVAWNTKWEGVNNYDFFFSEFNFFCDNHWHF